MAQEKLTNGLTQRQIASVQNGCEVFKEWAAGNRSFCNAECQISGQVPVCPPATENPPAAAIPTSKNHISTKSIFVFDASLAPVNEEIHPVEVLELINSD